MSLLHPGAPAPKLDVRTATRRLGRLPRAGAPAGRWEAAWPGRWAETKGMSNWKSCRGDPAPLRCGPFTPAPRREARRLETRSRGGGRVTFRRGK